MQAGAEAGNSVAASRVRTCCFCIPLRLGIFINALGTIVGSLSMMFAKHEFEESMRIFGGGYAMLSRTIIGFLEITGCMWGIIGVMGVWQCKEHFLQIYNLYQMARVVTWFGMYATDGPLLWNCELWLTDIKEAIQISGYNPIMYRIALEGRCQQERFYFFFFSTISLLFFIYLTRINQIYQAQLAEEPAYVLRIPKLNPGGAYYPESLGEMRYLLRDSDSLENRLAGHHDRLVGQSVYAPRSGAERSAYYNPENYHGHPRFDDGTLGKGLPPTKKTAWEQEQKAARKAELEKAMGYQHNARWM